MKNMLLGLLIVLSGTMATAGESKTIAVEVTEKGFVPNAIDVKPGTNVTLQVTRKTDSTCATEIQIPSQNVKKDLPLNQTVTVALGKLDKGEVRFGCGMNMMEGGKILVH